MTYVAAIIRLKHPQTSQINAICGLDRIFYEVWAFKNSLGETANERLKKSINVAIFIAMRKKRALFLPTGLAHPRPHHRWPVLPSTEILTNWRRSRFVSF